MTEDHVSNVSSDLAETIRKVISHHVNDRVYLGTSFLIYHGVSVPLNYIHDVTWEGLYQYL